MPRTVVLSKPVFIPLRMVSAARSVLSTTLVLCPRKPRLPRVSQMRSVLCSGAFLSSSRTSPPLPPRPVTRRPSPEETQRPGPVVGELPGCLRSFPGDLPSALAVHVLGGGPSRSPRTPQKRGHTTHTAGASRLLLDTRERWRCWSFLLGWVAFVTCQPLSQCLFRAFSMGGA